MYTCPKVFLVLIYSLFKKPLLKIKVDIKAMYKT